MELGFFSCCLVYRLYYIELGAFAALFGKFCFFEKI